MKALLWSPGGVSELGADGQGPAPKVPAWDWQPASRLEEGEGAAGQGTRLGRSVAAG